jgi:hypothetical protein
MKRTTVLRTGTALTVAATAFAGFTAIGGGAAAGTLNNLTVTQQVTDGAASGHTKVLVDVKNAGGAASTVVVTGLLTTTSGGAGFFESGGGWTCALQGPPTGWKYMYTCTVSSLAANSTSRLTLDLSGTAGAGFTNFVSVGERSPGETSIGDNTNTVNSYFGPRADLRVTQSVGATASAGHVIVTTRTTNRGPWTAHNLQLVVEVKAAGTLSASATSSTPSAACQVIPPASGYNLAFSCNMNGSLAPGATWTIVVNHHGPAGNAVQIVSTTTAISPSDPVPANNTATSNTHYHS